MNGNSTRKLIVEPPGDGVVAHVGLHALGQFADRLGLGAALSEQIPWAGERAPMHDRGSVLVHAMLMLAGRYVLHTSLDPDKVNAAEVVRHYRGLLDVEHRFRVLKDFLRLRPIRHWTEQRVRGHVATCVWASVIEALINNDLRSAKMELRILAGVMV